jgi:hypothetical protein
LATRPYSCQKVNWGTDAGNIEKAV